MNIQKVDDVVSKRLRAISETLDVREKHDEISLISFEANLMLVVRFFDDIFWGEFLENAEQIIDCGRKRIETRRKISDIIIRGIWQINSRKMLIFLHFVQISGDFPDIFEKPLVHKHARNQKSADDKHDNERNNCKKQIVWAHDVWNMLRPQKIAAPIFLIFINSVILPQIRSKKNRAVRNSVLKILIHNRECFIIWKFHRFFV